MRIDGIQLREGSSVTNMVIASGSAFPNSPNPGELFFRNDSENIGLHVYYGSQWEKIFSSGQSISLPSDTIPGTYKSVTVTAQGLVSAGTNPTTLAGYGIVDAQTLDADLTAIAALVGTSGLLKKTAADTWTLDTNTYITGNQTITLTGGVTGSGTTSITTTVVTNANLTGPITSVGNTTSIASQSGGGSTFVMSDTPLLTGHVTVTGNGPYLPASTTIAAATTMTSALEVTSQGVNAAAGAAFMSFHRPGSYAVHFGLDTDNILKLGGYSAGAVSYTIWHSGNDGAGSNLDADLLDGQQGSYYLDLANTTGLGAGVATFLASPSSANLAAALTDETGTGSVVFSHSPLLTGTVYAQAISSSGLLSANAGITIPTGQVITITDSPSVGTSAANKNYVDSVVAGLAWKNSVQAATTAAITLSGAQTIDGVSVIAGDRVLVKNQASVATNGIYVVAAGAWTRSTDMDSSTPINEFNGAGVHVVGGSTQSNTSWTVASTIVTVDTDAVNWAQFSGASVVAAGAGITLTGNTISITNATAVANLSGVNTGDQTTISGNAATATALATARTIGGSSFDGTANVTSFPVPGPIGGTTPNTGAFTVLTTSSTSGGRVTTADGSVIKTKISSTDAAWASMTMYEAASSALSLGAFGAFGSTKDTADYSYIAAQGQDYNTSSLKVTPSGVIINGALTSGLTKYGVAVLNQGNEYLNGVKIKTDIAWANNAFWEVHIHGYHYRQGTTVDLRICSYQYSTPGNPINYSASSAGGWAPSITMVNESGFISIVLGLNKNDGYFLQCSIDVTSQSTLSLSGWTVVDETGTGISVLYRSDFGYATVNNLGMNVLGGVTLTTTDGLGGLVVSGAAQSAIFNSTSGSYSTWQHNGSSIGDVGTGNQVFSGGTITDLGITARTGGRLVLGANGSSKAILDTAGNFGLGVTPSAWAGAHGIEQVNGGFFSTAGTYLYLTSNLYYDGAYKYKTSTSGASRYEQGLGTHTWYGAPAGTAGDVISFGVPKMLLDLSGNLGLGVTPSAWDTSFKALQVRGFGIMVGSTGYTYQLANAYFDGGAYRYVASSFALKYEMVSGAHAWFTAPSGTAGNTITFTQAMSLDASSTLTVAGAVNSATGLNITGNGGFYNAANKFGIDHTSGASRFYSSGPDTVTRGTFEFHPNSSDGSLDFIAMKVFGDGRLHLTQSSANQVLQSFTGVGGTNAYVDFAAVEIGGQTSNGAWLRWTRGGSNDRVFSIHTTDSAATSYKTLTADHTGIQIIGAVTSTGPLSVNAVTQDTTTTAVTTTSATVVDSVSSSAFRTAKYIVQVTDSTNSQYHAVEILVIHDGTTVFKTEYGEITTAASLGTFDAAIVTGTLRLSFTAVAATTKSVKVYRAAITA